MPHPTWAAEPHAALEVAVGRRDVGRNSGVDDHAIVDLEQRVDEAREPHRAIGRGRERGSFHGFRERDGRELRLPEPLNAAGRSDPHVAFAVFERRVPLRAGSQRDSLHREPDRR